MQGHWVLRLVMSYTRQGIRFVAGYQTRVRRYDLLREVGSASCDISHETRRKICYRHWVLRLVISYTRRGIRFLPVIGFCDFDLTHETRGTI